MARRLDRGRLNPARLSGGRLAPAGRRCLRRRLHRGRRRETGWPQPGWGGAGAADGAVGGGDGAIGGGATGADWLGWPVGGSCGSDTFPS